MKLCTLKKRHHFVQAANSGRRCRTSSVLVQAHSVCSDPVLEQSAACCWVGFTATRKLGGAVVRNRAKRRLRAVVRELLPECVRTQDYYVFVAREGLLQADYTALCKDIRYALKRLTMGQAQ